MISIDLNPQSLISVPAIDHAGLECMTICFSLTESLWTASQSTHLRACSMARNISSFQSHVSLRANLCLNISSAA